MNRRWISLILILAMLFSLTVPAFAETPAVTSGSVVNPLYVNYPAPDDNDAAGRRLARSASAGGVADASVQAAAYVSPETAANQLRTAMMNRTQTGIGTLSDLASGTSNENTSKRAQQLLESISAKNTIISLYVDTSDFWAKDSGKNNWLYQTLFQLALSQQLSDCPYDADYLRWTWQKLNWFIVSSSGTKYHFLIDIKMYTTSAEERIVQNKVSGIVSSLDISSKSIYDAYSAIYDYIVSNITYDYEYQYGIQTYTAYGAVVNQSAVCQGYATLFYALCRKADLPVRVMYTPEGYIPGHAWNIVKIGNLWYNLDSTWESTNGSGRSYFLKGSAQFDQEKLHTKSPDLTTLSFQSAHPISAADYVPGSEPEQDAPFYTDVPQGRWSYDSIQAATRLGLMQGTGNGKFDPQMEVSRGMLVTVLWRMEGSPECSSAGFSDVASGRYFAKAVDWAAANGIVLGVGNNRFAPDMIATREQTVTILYRYLQYLHKDVSAQDSLSRFTDAGAVSNFAKTPIRWAVAKGLMNGTSSHSLSPKDSITREQMTTLIVRAISTYGL